MSRRTHLLLKQTFLELHPDWSEEDVEQYTVLRFAEAYLLMAELQYRPAAPGDGLGNISRRTTRS
jgi:hypothetical protein